MGVQGIAHSLVALRGQVKVIVHVLMGDATIGVDEAWVHIEERGMGERQYSLLDQLVHHGISLPERVWLFTSGQYTLENRFMCFTVTVLSSIFRNICTALYKLFTI